MSKTNKQQQQQQTKITGQTLLFGVFLRSNKQDVSKQYLYFNKKDATGQTGGVKGILQSVTRGKGVTQSKNEKCGGKLLKVSAAA